jgi:putative FmdB family regulatory protein
MPIYEYQCQDCGTNFEQLVPFSRTTEPVCASCESIHVKRQVGRPAVHFKGSGWYSTDSKKASGTSSQNGE